MREKSTKCLHFSYLAGGHLNDLEMTLKVIGKTIIELFHESYSYKYIDFIIPA